MDHHEEIETALAVLLALDPRSPADGLYSEEALERRMRRDRRPRRLELLFHRLAPACPTLAAECGEVLRRTSFTDRQREVLVLWLSGMSLVEIGARAGRTKQAVRNVLRAALDRLSRAWRAYPWAGWAEVYRAETRRGR